MSSQEAVDIVAASQERQPQKKLNSFLAAQEVIVEAARRWKDEEGDYRDDITAVVIALPLFNEQGTGLATISTTKPKSSLLKSSSSSSHTLKPKSPRSPLFRRKKTPEKEKETDKSPAKKRGMLRRIISVKETDASPSGIKM